MLLRDVIVSLGARASEKRSRLLLSRDLRIAAHVATSCDAAWRAKDARNPCRGRVSGFHLPACVILSPGEQ